MNLGPLSAEEDELFHQHFIETKYINRLLNNDSNIVFGAKGVGKTALMRALTELKGNNYLNYLNIDLSKIIFESVHHKLSELNSTTKTDLSNLASATWKNMLIGYSLLCFSEILPENNPLKAEIYRTLKSDGFFPRSDSKSIADSNHNIIQAIENFVIKISQLSINSSSESKNLSTEQMNIVNHFPLNNEIGRLLKQVIPLVRSSGKKILICLDGFDSIVRHTPESRKIIFSGLIDAILKLRLDNELYISSAFCFVAFLPQELTFGANPLTWDIDKHSYNIHNLRWEEDDFKAFLGKRIAFHSKKKYNKFTDTWLEFMPDKIMNHTHNIEENTFDYIIRHTLYRPRQVLEHVQKIFRDWSETNNSSDRVAASFIPSVVARNNKEMAKNIIFQLQKIYPNIDNFMYSWRGYPPIIESEVFRDRIKRYFDTESIEEIDKIIDEFFDFGIYGVQSKKNMANFSKKLKFHFSYVGDTYGTSIHNFIGKEEMIAVSPIFKEYCNCTSSNEGIIVPISMDYD